MDRQDALESIKEVWDREDLSLGERVIQISTAYYSTGLKLDEVASRIHATQSELDSFLQLSYFEDEVIELLSEVNPPKSTWNFLANASEEEVVHALHALSSTEKRNDISSNTISEFVYYAMIEVAGLTVEQKVALLSEESIRHALKKGTDFGAVNDWEKKFLKSIAGYKKRGQDLSDKQSAKLAETLRGLAEKGAITHNSIDGDQEICDEILEALDL